MTTPASPAPADESAPVPASAQSMFFPDLARLAAGAGTLKWELMRKGVERCWLYQAGDDGHAAALIRFQPGARVPVHEHTGYEHIYILSGSQHDGTCTATEGGLLVSPPGTRHWIASETGCLVLAIYEKPVRFLGDGL